jgi:hypothetical protein
VLQPPDAHLGEGDDRVDVLAVGQRGRDHAVRPVADDASWLPWWSFVVMVVFKPVVHACRKV